MSADCVLGWLALCRQVGVTLLNRQLPWLSRPASYEPSAFFNHPTDPSVVALQQARLLHPDLPVDVLVSLGCGQGPTETRGRSVHSMMDTGEGRVKGRALVAYF